MALEPPAVVTAPLGGLFTAGQGQGTRWSEGVGEHKRESTQSIRQQITREGLAAAGTRAALKQSTPSASSALPCVCIQSRGSLEAWGGATWQQSGEGPGPSSLNLRGWRHPESQEGKGRSWQGHEEMCGAQGGTPLRSEEKGPGAGWRGSNYRRRPRDTGWRGAG